MMSAGGASLQEGEARRIAAQDPERYQPGERGPIAQVTTMSQKVVLMNRLRAIISSLPTFCNIVGTLYFQMF